MITANEKILNEINSPVRHITARVELYNGSTLVDTFNHNDRLIDFSVERVSEEGKFFGFGICQHIKVNIIDLNREIDYITTNYSLKVAYGVDDEYIYTHPTFHITQTRRDENTNELSIYGYDLIYSASKHTLNETGLTAPYTILNVAEKVAETLNASGVSIQRLNDNETCFALEYAEGANFDGSELLRDVLNDVAEATQTIYYADVNNDLVFKRLSDTIAPDIEMTKQVYIKLDTKDGRRLAKIVSATELGDNYGASIDATGTTAYVRDNAFWVLRDDVGTLVDNALAAVGGMSIRQFECEWRGNFLSEPGDKIALTTKDNDIVMSYLLDDTIEYNGIFQETTKWTYSDESEDTESNPTSLGDILNKTTAKVDKAQQTITLAVNKVDGYDNRLTQLELDKDGITASVQQIQQNTEGMLEAMTDEIATLTNKVDATITPEAVEIQIQEALGEGTNQIITSTGFTFNDEGLTVSKSGSEMTTTITEDGMSVYKDGAEVLTADNTGVKAIDLRATTYLHIGTYSRFQDYDGSRTGCFWIL